MAEYLSPGVYIEEVNTGPRPIEGVGTACAAFVGFAAAGPIGKPTLITNWSQYVETFGLEEQSEHGGRFVNPHTTIPANAQNKRGEDSKKQYPAYLSHAVYG